MSNRHIGKDQEQVVRTAARIVNKLFKFSTNKLKDGCCVSNSKINPNCHPSVTKQFAPIFFCVIVEVNTRKLERNTHKHDLYMGEIKLQPSKHGGKIPI